MANDRGFFIPNSNDWSGFSSDFAKHIASAKYAHKDDSGNPKEDWMGIAHRVGMTVGDVYPYVNNGKKELSYHLVDKIYQRKFLPGGRYLYATGRPYHMTCNCYMYRAEDSREGWSDVLRKTSLALMTGGGLGVDYTLLREEGAPIRKTGGYSSGPIALMQMVNEIGRHAMQGGSRRSAIWAGLLWSHPDVFKFIHLKDWSAEVRAMKERDFNFPATMDMTNISVILDREFFDVFEDESHPKHSLARKVYYETCEQMFKKSEPGFSINYDNPRESLRNACCELVSEDDSDVCNLASVNMSKVYDIDEFAETLEYTTKFCILGSLYSDVPHSEVISVRDKNRRIGVGLMGIHEWLLTRGYTYETNNELAQWLDVYKNVTETVSCEFADYLGISRPVKQRAIAPTGTIGIVGETTTGIEPIFCAAYKRRYLKGKFWHYEYVVDPTARRIIEQMGVPVERVEDAYFLADTTGFERRVAFQAFVQQYVDHAISSTINQPAWGSKANNESNVRQRADILYKYLPYLRGITCYTDGSRGGQPLTPVDYHTAMAQVGNVFEESVDVCDITGTGSCGT